MDNRPLAIIDSGLGGLSVAEKIWEQLPRESTIYLADHQFFPYGDKTTQQINRRLVGILNFLSAQNSKAVVIACNTITTNSIDILRQLYNLPFVGTEPAIKPAIEPNLKENIVVLSTTATAKSKSFNQLINQLDKKGKVVLHPCRGLVEDIEKFANQPAKIEKSIEKHLQKIKDPFSTLVLGCTHYALVRNIIKNLVPPHVLVIEPSQAIAKQTEKILKKESLLSTLNPSKKIFLTTGNAQKASQAASSLLNQGIIFTRCSL